MSTLKLIDELKASKDPNIFTGRMDEDFMPFRGANPGLMREEEYEELTDVTHDAHVGTFNVMIEEERKALEQVLDRSVNGWYVIYKKTDPIRYERDGELQLIVYCEWSVPHRQLNMQRAGSFGPLPR